MTEQKRSPIKAAPLRMPGQSLQEEWRSLLEDKIEPWLMLVVFFLAFAGWEWFRHFTSSPPRPGIVSLAAGLVTVFAAWRFFRLRPRLRQLRLGMDGERAVGQFLERLREQGYQVFHDVPGTDFNVDHVLIGPAGLFTVETKTWSKSTARNDRIEFDGERVLVNGHEPERDVVAQAQGQAKWLARTLEESTGRRMSVQPVVVFPGWFVQAAPGAHRAVWMMEPKGLPAFLANEPARLMGEDVKLAAFHLSRYVRSCEKNR